MDALYLDSQNKLDAKKLDKPRLGRQNDILIKVAFAGLCGTDLHIIAGKFPSAKDIVIGHEFVGTIVEKGNAVTELAVGDKV